VLDRFPGHAELSQIVPDHLRPDLDLLELLAVVDRYLPSDISRPLPEGWYGHLHSIYVHYAAERGIPTMLMLVWLLVKVLFDFLRALRRLPPGPSEEKFLLHGAVAVVVAIMAAGFFELNLGDSEVLTMFLVVVGLGYAARDRALSLPQP